MPEGPSIVILKESVAQFKGKRVLEASSTDKQLDTIQFEGQIIADFKSFGKNFLICFKDATIHIHLMMFGSYRINEHKNTPAKLSLHFTGGDELNFYTCIVDIPQQPIDELYDWTADVMSDVWDSAKAIKKLKAEPKNTMICDALLNQHIFAGVGNIIKNEVLFNTKIHPESLIAKIPDKKLKEIVNETVRYSFDFLKWKKENTLKKHWLAYNKVVCPRNDIMFHKAKTGKTKRQSYFCPLCQQLYH